MVVVGSRMSRITRPALDELDRIAVEVRDAAYAVIRGKGATNLAIGVSCARIAEAVLHDERAVLPVATVLDGEYGIVGAAVTVPVTLARGGVRKIHVWDLRAEDLDALRASAELVRAAVADAGGTSPTRCSC